MKNHQGTKGTKASRVKTSLIAACLCALCALVVPSGSTQQQLEAETAYVCPMHPDYTLDIEGKCARCGMALVRAAPYDVRDYRLDFATVPAVVKPGQKAALRFKVFHPGTGELVKRFETVHDRQYHLFVIGQDMEYFQHLHPEQQRDGSWSIDVTLPKAGYYKVLSDFMPGGGTAQFIARPFVTTGYIGDLANDSARLIPDTALAKTVDDMTATVAYDPAPFVAGLYGHLNFILTGARTGRPVTDLQTYLGEFGHMLIMSEDMVHYVHSHPLNMLAMAGDDDGAGPHLMLPPGADLEKLRGGPEVSFDGLMPQPGLYRAWTQFRRNDKIYTFAFTFNVEAP